MPRRPSPARLPGPRLAALAVLSFGTGACRPAAPPTPAATSAETCPVAVPTPRGAPRLAPAEAELRTRGLAALDGGAWHLARRAFAAVLAVVPDDLAALALHDAVTRAMLADQQAAAAAFAAARPLVVPAPPDRATVVRPATVPRRPAPRPTLVRTSHDRTSDDEWMRSHCLVLPEHQVPNPMRGDPGDVPPGTAPLYGEHVLAQAIAGDDVTVLLYGPDYRGGRFVAVQTRNGRRLAFFDLAAWAGERGDRVATWAAVADGVLLVAIGRRDHARDPAGDYLAALDLRTGELLWRSAPAVAGAADFVVDGAHILSAHGDGSSARLLVLERRTGAVVGEHPIDGEPLYLLPGHHGPSGPIRGRRLFVRTTAADHEFELR